MYVTKLLIIYTTIKKMLLFFSRGNKKYISSLGKTVANFSRVVPGGVLVFFPSYGILRQCRDVWKETSAVLMNQNKVSLHSIKYK
jgi:Rad3-related DNA helicase